MPFPALVLAALQLVPAPPAPQAPLAFDVAEGLEVSLWAEAPMLFNPTALDVDARGRIWVTEAVNYRQWRGRNAGFTHPEGDRVLILEDSDGDGRADRSSVFVQDKDLVAPLGLCVVDERRVLVSCSPNAFLYTDTDGDGKADRRETFLTGFGGHDHDHGLHSFVIGPDGRYYVAAGNAGPHVVTDRDGFHLRSSSLYNDGGEFLADNKPGLVSDDGHAWTGGLILRVDEDGGGLSVRAHNFRNQYEVAVDAYGDLFTSDNDDDGSQGCRALWVLPRSNNGYFSSDGARFWGADRRPGQPILNAHWHQDDPGVAPIGTILGAGGPTGVAVIENADLGAKYEGWMLAADAGASVVYGLAPSRAGAGVELAKSAFLASRDGGGGAGASHFFRPSDVLIGTDGALYVADWHDAGVGGHAMADKRGYGRILRVARPGATKRSPKIDLASTDGCIAALASPAVNVRGRAARALIADPAAIAKLAQPAPEGSPVDPRVRARISWILAHAGAAPGADERTAADPALLVVELRARASDAKSRAALAGHPDARVRSELALLLEGDASHEAKALFLELAAKLDPSDRTLLEALGIAARGREAECFDALAAGAPDPLAWNALLAALAWRLHPPSCVAAVRARAMAESLSPAERSQAIDTLAFVQERAAGEALLDVALAGPADLREAARWWIRFRDQNDWSAWRLAAQLGSGERENARVLYESPLMKAGSAALDVELHGATHLYLVVDDGGNGIGCDWGDWADARLIGPEGEVALSSLPWSDATAGWGQVRRDANCEGGPLVVAGATYASGIGTHANSEIAYALPEGRFERLRAVVGPDQRGVAQGCGTSVRFRVLAVIPPDPAQYAAAESVLLDAKLSAAERRTAAQTLCSTREGGLYVLASANKGRYDEATTKILAREIFQNPDLAVRALASERFPRAAGALPSVAELEALAGDERNGERVFFGTTASCGQCHTFAGRGGDVGPDLTRLRDKYAAGQMLDAILNPSAAIAFGYDTWLLETDDDRVVSGFLLADGDKVILKDTAGVRVVLSKDEIVARRKATVSAMPDNVAMGVSPQELADVVAFLRADRDAPRKLGEPVALFNGVDLNGWTHHLDAPGTTAADVWSVADGVLDCKGSPIGYLRTEKEYEDFVLELDWRFPAGGKPGNSGVLMRRVGPDKVWPKSVEAQLQHRSAGDIWNIDDVAMQVDPARTQGRHTEKLAPCNEVPQGEWNHYKITLDRGELRLEVNGTLQNTASWVERVPGHIGLQSEGSRIQFRNVVLRELR